MVGTVKTTIETTTKDISVSPGIFGDRVTLEFLGFPDADGNRQRTGVSLSQDQLGALIFGLEQAAEAAQLKNARRLAA